MIHSILIKFSKPQLETLIESLKEEIETPSIKNMGRDLNDRKELLEDLEKALNEINSKQS